MRLLCDTILQEGRVLPGNVLKVDSFLNHQLNISLLAEMGKEFYRLYQDCGVNKVLTIESSGIGIACFTAQFFDVPVVFAKKSRSANIPDAVYSAPVHSFTHGNDYRATVARRFLGEKDRVLIIDDFLANGSALKGLCEICREAGCTVLGAGIAIEKTFQGGGKALRDTGLRIESLAKVASMSDDALVFEEESLR